MGTNSTGETWRAAEHECKTTFCTWDSVKLDWNNAPSLTTDAFCRPLIKLHFLGNCWAFCHMHIKVNTLISIILNLPFSDGTINRHTEVWENHNSWLMVSLIKVNLTFSGIFVAEKQTIRAVMTSFERHRVWVPNLECNLFRVVIPELVVQQTQAFGYHPNSA